MVSSLLKMMASFPCMHFREYTKFPCQKLCPAIKCSQCSFCDHFCRFPFSLSHCVYISVEFANKLVLETIHWCSHLNHDVTWNLLTTLFALNGCSLFIYMVGANSILFEDQLKIVQPCWSATKEESTKHSYFTWNISVWFCLDCDVDDFILLLLSANRSNKRKEERSLSS